MKNLIAITAGLFLTIAACSQNNGEFEMHPNGLIYSDRTMEKLGSIVDSLNLKYKTCDFDKVFYAKQQTVGHLAELDTGDLESAIKDLEQNISFEDFDNKYPDTRIKRNILILRSKYKSYDEKDLVRIEHFDLESDYGARIISEDLALFDRNFKDNWAFEHSPKSDYSKEKIRAFFFPENFQTPALPQKYSLMIGYSDCLIDTTTTRLKDELENGWVELPENWVALPENDKAELLDDMRSTRVIGFCSMDSRPREHAVHIALLSAETHNWEVFLKAHLDIMNDRFERVSDGSYAWGQRDTYIRELEELRINVLDLILGISFRIENPASNHYYGNIGRIGRALSETKNRIEVEEALLGAICDSELDNYNRLLFYFLFKNYNYFIDDEPTQTMNNQKLATAASTLPEYFGKRLMAE